MRSWRALSVVVVLSAIAAACGGVGRGQVAVRVATDSRRAVRDGHLVQPLFFDGGTLRLDVAQGSSRVDEEHAIGLFRAGSPPWSLVESVTVVYADATLRLPVETAGMVIQPRVIPAFQHRPAWAFIWSNGPHSCPLETTKSTLPEPENVELIAADGSGEGVSYQTRGSPCAGPVTPPHAEIASYYVSLPWSTAPTTGSDVAVRSPVPPPCGDIEYTPSSGSADTETFGVYAFVLMARPPCSTPRQHTSTLRSFAARTVLLHDRTGLSLGRFTAPAHFTYFDGLSHTTT